MKNRTQKVNVITNLLREKTNCREPRKVAEVLVAANLAEMPQEAILRTLASYLGLPEGSEISAILPVEDNELEVSYFDPGTRDWRFNIVYDFNLWDYIGSLTI